MQSSKKRQIGRSHYIGQQIKQAEIESEMKETTRSVLCKERTKQSKIEALSQSAKDCNQQRKSTKKIKAPACCMHLGHALIWLVTNTKTALGFGSCNEFKIVGHALRSLR